MGVCEIYQGTKGELWFTINRPEKRNAVNFEVMEGFERVIEMAEKTRPKALMITGSGDQAFCSGGDLSVFHNLYTEEEAYSMLSKMAGILSRLLLLPIPTVAVLNGVALGGGCEIAAACDFRMVHKRAKAGFIQGNLGITTGWGGGNMLLEKLSVQQAMKLLAGAKIHSASELLDIGFADAVYDENLSEMVENILEKEAGVLSAYKQMLIHKWSAASLPYRIEMEVQNCARLWATEEHHQKVRGFLKK